MITLEKSARRHAIAASTASVGVYVAFTACWFLRDEVRLIAAPIWVVAVSLTIPILILLLMPLEKVADLLARHLQPQPVDRQFENVVSEIAIALAEPVESIQSYPSPVANILMMPCSHGEIVVATTGALEQLNRHE